jgi:hypothetical protein
METEQKAPALKRHRGRRTRDPGDRGDAAGARMTAPKKTRQKALPAAEVFTDRETLGRAVLAECKTTYRRLTRHRFTNHERANFSDRERPTHEQEARALMERLREVLVQVAVFSRDYQREPLSQAVVGPNGCELAAPETSDVRRLLRFVETQLPGLDGRVRDTDDRIVALNGYARDAENNLVPTGALGSPTAPWFTVKELAARLPVPINLGSRPSSRAEIEKMINAREIERRRTRVRLTKLYWIHRLHPIRALEATAEGWSVETRGRVVSLLGCWALWRKRGELRRELRAIGKDLSKTIAAGEVEVRRDGRVRIKAGYWKNLGFKSAPDVRTMACVSLLLLPTEAWPTIHAARLADGMRVEDLLELEGKAIRAQRSRMVAQWEAKNRLVRWPRTLRAS